MTYSKVHVLPTGLSPVTLAALLALSSVPIVEAQQVCKTDDSGKVSCYYRPSNGVIVGIVFVSLLVLGIACSLFFYCRQRIRANTVKETTSQMVFVPDIVVPPPTTNGVQYKPPKTAPVWGTHYHPETGQPTITGAPPSRSTRYSVSYAREPQYPALAYPFTGYAVPPPLTHGAPREYGKESV
jgi:hypothetical protein